MKCLLIHNSPNRNSISLSGFLKWVTKKEEQGGLQWTFVSVLMLLDSLFPVLVRHWVSVGTAAVIPGCCILLSSVFHSPLLITVDKYWLNITLE